MTNKRIKQITLIILIIANISTLFWIDPLKENLSLFANTRFHHFLLILWGGSTSIYFYFYTSALMKRFSYPYKLLRIALFLSCLMMLVSVLLPYNETRFPIISKWHVRVAMSGVACYLLLFFHLLSDIMKKDYTFYAKSMSYYTSIVVLEALFFLLYGSVSALLEVSFVIAMASLLYAMSENMI